MKTVPELLGRRIKKIKKICTINFLVLFHIESIKPSQFNFKKILKHVNMFCFIKTGDKKRWFTRFFRNQSVHLHFRLSFSLRQIFPVTPALLIWERILQTDLILTSVSQKKSNCRLQPAARMTTSDNEKFFKVQ